MTEIRLERSRLNFSEIANIAALLFFIVSKLNLVDVMYQYSLSWFINLFTVTIDKSASRKNTEETDPDFVSPDRKSNAKTRQGT
jgi:dynein heavy chain